MFTFRAAIHWYIIALIVGLTFDACSMTSYNPYDPLPLYSSANPHEFLGTRQKDLLRGIPPELDDERGNITVSFFWQTATSAKNEHRKKVALGDIHGPWNMLALTYTVCPEQTELTPLLKDASKVAFCNTFNLTSTSADNPAGQLFFGNEKALTFTQVSENIGPLFGQVSVPLRYQKFGARFEASLLVLEDIGVTLQGGFAEVQQMLTSTNNVQGFFDLSTFDLPVLSESCPIVDPCCVQANLANVQNFLTGTGKVAAIAEELNWDTCSFHKTDFEDLRGSLFWRHAIPFNENREGWPRFLLMPFTQVIGTLATGPKISPYQAFSVASGNNGHDSLGFNVGLALDFEETLELVAEAGGTFFSSENKLLRMPVNKKQQGIFPCITQACVKPGNNWHFIGTINARRFIDKLSAHAQIVFISHSKDAISVRQPSNSTVQFFPEVITCTSKWSWRMFTLALNYEISPNLSLGLVYQGPLERESAPKTKTLLGSLVATF